MEEQDRRQADRGTHDPRQAAQGGSAARIRALRRAAPRQGAHARGHDAHRRL